MTTQCRWLPSSFDTSSSNSKRALLIGIEYSGRDLLTGPVENVRKMSQVLLTRHYYENKDLLVLTDSNSTGIVDVEHKPATKDSILHALSSIRDRITPEERLVVYFSGQGQRVMSKARKGKIMEDDGMDECMLPSDHSTSGSIIDDKLHDILVKSLPRTVRLTTIFDCSHSGTIMDLPFIFDPENEGAGFVFDDGLQKSAEVISQAKQVFGSAAGHVKQGSLVSAFHGVGAFVGKHRGKKKYSKRKIDSEIGEVICLSACRDEETSVRDSTSECGKMTELFVERMNESTEYTWEENLKYLREELEELNQTPQLSFSRVLSVSEKCTM